MARDKTALRRKNSVREAVATIGLLIMLAGGGLGAYLGYRAGGLGTGFLGLLIGVGLGFGLVYSVTNLVRQNPKFFTVLAALLALALVVWGLNALGDGLGLNPK